ncbi:MAG: hypothetical protein ACYCYO_19275 [Bacilli bacterium]
MTPIRRIAFALSVTLLLFGLTSLLPLPHPAVFWWPAYVSHVGMVLVGFGILRAVRIPVPHRTLVQPYWPTFFWAVIPLSIIILLLSLLFPSAGQFAWYQHGPLATTLWILFQTVIVGWTEEFFSRSSPISPHQSLACDSVALSVRLGLDHQFLVWICSPV